MKIFVIVAIVAAVGALIAVRLLRNRLVRKGLSQAGSESGGVASARIKKTADVNGLSIKLEIDGKTSLFILLGADGSINRMGTGALENTESGLFVGITDPAIFELVRGRIAERLMQRLGREYKLPNPRGAQCTLAVIFQFKDGTSNGIRYLYGSESERVPEDVAQLVLAAVHRTDPWHENFIQATLRKGKPEAQ
jgi:hypothetical protein